MVVFFRYTEGIIWIPMLYSTTCSYAIRAMCRLTAIGGKHYVQVGDVCAGTDLPAPFVAKVMRELVSAGLLTSSKGRGGGYALAKPATRIRLLDIVEAIDGRDHCNRCVVGLDACNDKQPCPQHEAFKPVRAEITEYLKNTTLDQMADALTEKMELIGKRFPGGDLGRPVPKR